MPFTLRAPYRRLASVSSVSMALLLTGLLTGCGSSSDSANNPPDPSPSQKIDVAFTAPEAQKNVYDVNTPVLLDVRVDVNGNPIANNNTVTFTAPSGSLSPEQALTVGGHATTTLTGSQVGALQIQAKATVANESNSSTHTLYMRPAHQPLEILVPAYFAAGKDSPWDLLIASAESYPDVKITVILNPDNGIFTEADTDYTDAIADFKATGKTHVDGGWNRKVIGYVATAYGEGQRSVVDIKANVDNYRTLYPSVEGIFLDEMANKTNRVEFYSEIYNYIKTLDRKLWVVGNPGTHPPAVYAGLADSLVTFEGKESAYQSIDPQPSHTWVYNQNNLAQIMLVHDAFTCVSMQNAVAHANLARTNTGVIYVTDLPYDFTTNVGNPWARLPTYWTTLLGTVDAMNKNQALPAC